MCTPLSSVIIYLPHSIPYVPLLPSVILLKFEIRREKRNQRASEAKTLVALGDVPQKSEVQYRGSVALTGFFCFNQEIN